MVLLRFFCGVCYTSSVRCYTWTSMWDAGTTFAKVGHGFTSRERVERAKNLLLTSPFVRSPGAIRLAVKLSRRGVLTEVPATG